MVPSVEQLRETYKQYADDKLIQLATREAAKLRPEALVVLKEEITARGIPDDIYNSDSALKKITESQLNEYCTLLRSQLCPICSSSSQKLNAAKTGKVISAVFITRYEKKNIIACPDCLDKANQKALYASVFLGWWGIPWGIIRTINAIILNNKSLKENRMNGPNPALISIITSNAGKLELIKNDPGMVRSFISHLN